MISEKENISHPALVFFFLFIYPPSSLLGVVINPDLYT